MLFDELVVVLLDVLEGVHLDLVFEDLEESVEFVALVDIGLVEDCLLDELVPQVVDDLALYIQVRRISG